MSTEIRSMTGHVRYIPDPCEHTDAVPVESVTGELVAYLCLDCDQQLPWFWIRP